MTRFYVSHGQDVIFWTVEWFAKSMNQWFPVSATQLAEIPHELRYDKQRRFLEPFKSFGANGDVWQKTRNNGYWDQEPAEQLCKQLMDASPGLQFRVARVHVTCSVQDLESFNKMIAEDFGDEQQCLVIKYKCYSCQHEWTEVWSCACDSECPECGARDVQAKDWKEVEDVFA